MERITIPQLILPAVAAAIFNDQGEVLLQRRRDVNQWCILSGHVEFGESVQEAVLREVFEETGVEGKIERLIGLYSSPLDQTYHYHHACVQYVTSYFQVQLQSPLPGDYSKKESYELDFFSTNALPVNIAQMSHHWLNDALTMNQVFLR